MRPSTTAPPRFSPAPAVRPGAMTPSPPTGRARRRAQVMRSLEEDYGLREVSAWPIEPLHMHCAVLQVPDGADRGAVACDACRTIERIMLAATAADLCDAHRCYNDPYVALQRGFQQMDVADAHPWSRGEGVKVAIIDTGVDIGHPDLARSIAAAENFVDSDERPVSARPPRHRDCRRHRRRRQQSRRHRRSRARVASARIQGLLADPQRRRWRTMQFLYPRPGAGCRSGCSCAGGQSEPRRSRGSDCSAI